MFQICGKVQSHEKCTARSFSPIRILTAVLEVNLEKTYEKTDPMLLVPSVGVLTACVRLRLYKTAGCVFVCHPWCHGCSCQQSPPWQRW